MARLWIPALFVVLTLLPSGVLSQTPEPPVAGPDEIVYTGSVYAPPGTEITAVFAGSPATETIICATTTTTARSAHSNVSRFVLVVQEGCAGRSSDVPSFCWGEDYCYAYHLEAPAALSDPYGRPVGGDVVHVGLLPADCPGVPLVAPDLGVGAIQGCVYSASEDRTPQTPVILVIPSDLAQPVALEMFLPDAGPDPFDRLDSTRSGPGLLRPGAQGEYSVTDLPAGEYLVGTILPLPGEYEVLPPEEVRISERGQVRTMQAFRVSVQEGSATIVDIVFALYQPEGPSRLRVCVSNYDRKTFVEGPDTITSIDIQSASGEQAAADGIAVVIAEDGCAVLENIPAGTYTITLETQRGFAGTHTIDIGPGGDGTINLGWGPPLPGGSGGLPEAGHGDSGGSRLLPVILGFAVFAAGALGFGVLRRRGA